MPASQYVGIVLRGIRAETDLTGVRSLLGQASTAINLYAAPANRPALRARFEEAVAGLLADAEPGSDHQLAFARAYSSAVFSDAGADRLAAWLDGRDLPSGLVVDTDLRWTLLHRLVSQGRAGLEQIDAELARDATDAGQRRAAAARAALPDPENKRQVWDEIVAGRLPNAMFRATLTGFANPDQEELTAPYRDPFFDVLLDIWANWSSDMAKRFVAIGYTICPIEQETIRVTDRYISRNQPPAALRRLLVEGRDDVARALRCRERDALAS
jgi:aminopeptidase N